ncbi:MAG: response regulator [Vicinamibacterales bacterium]
MHVLICDDDASTRLVIKRLLTQSLGCSATECVDGVEALRHLDDEKVDLVVLDVEMPLVNGVKVLETIRASRDHKTLPVLMLSKERREDVIVRLVRLGIEGYILKPPRTETVLAALERLRGALSTGSRANRTGNVQSIRLGPDTPTLLVEGNLDYRHFFVSQATRHGPIVEVGSGAVALAHFRQTPWRLVFLGSELGLVNAELLIPKLRAMAGSQPARIVGIVDPAGPSQTRGAQFDDLMLRSDTPDTFQTELRRFTRVSGPLAAVTSLTGDLTRGVTTAARQVFGMMLDAELLVRDSAAESEPMIAAVSDITIQGRYVVTLAIRGTVAAMTAIAARMLGMKPAEIGVEDYLSTCAELANLVSGRLHAHLDEKSIHSDYSLPMVQRDPAIWDVDSLEKTGVTVRFRVAGTTADVIVSVSVSDLLGDSADAVAASENLVA